jgi:hypothetical protein
MPRVPAIELVFLKVASIFQRLHPAFRLGWLNFEHSHTIPVTDKCNNAECVPSLFLINFLSWFPCVLFFTHSKGPHS